MGVDDAAPDEGSTESLRDTLTAAFDASEATSSRESTTATEAPISTGTLTPSEPPAEGATTSTAPREDGRDAQGRFAAKATATEAPTKGPSTATAPDLEKPAPSATLPVPAPPEASKAPQSWKPAAREKWAALPPEAQAEVLRRERETATVLQEAAESRRLHQAFQQTVSPFEGMIRAEGSDPLRAVSALLQTAAALRTAPLQQRAHMVANIVRTHGIPIEMLDAALSGQGPPPGQPQQQPMQDPRFDQFLAHLQQQQAQRNQQQTAQAQQQLQEFATAHEFYEDVREDMADMMEVAAKRGVAMSWEEAYNRAVLVNPSTSKVVEQRRAAEAANAQAASTQRARAAASSVKSQPVGPRNGHHTGGTLRDDLNAAFAEYEGR